MASGDAAARRAAAWRFLRAVLRSQADGVVGAALSGLAWQVGAVAARLIVAIRNRARGDAGIRDAIFAHALRLDATYHDRVGPGELMSRASSDSEQIARLLDAIGHTIGYVLSVVAVSVDLMTID